jgi:hypothetical protein
VSLQLFDKWYAFRQSLDTADYNANVLVTYSNKPIKGFLNIWFECMPETIKPEMHDYDLIFLCNTGEPLANAMTQPMIDLASKPNVYIIADGYLAKDHVMFDKIIWHPHDPLNCLNYWTRSFYPQFYNNLAHINQRKGYMCAVNGTNRSWRHYFFTLLQQSIPTLQVKNSYNALIQESRQAAWETEQDKEFRSWVNNTYGAHKYISDSYYNDIINVGIDKKFGGILPGYFILKQYFDYYCIIFPESTWQNDELCLSEKALKCFYTGCLPMPVGGRNVNKLYNSLGYNTAWNLLPESLQIYDSIQDHRERYQQQLLAIQWLYANPDVWHTDDATRMIMLNQHNFLHNRTEHIVVDKFNTLIEKIHDQLS